MLVNNSQKRYIELGRASPKRDHRLIENPITENHKWYSVPLLRKASI